MPAGVGLALAHGLDLLGRGLRHYNEVHTHQGHWCCGKTPMQTFLDSLPMAREKLLDQQNQPIAVAC